MRGSARVAATAAAVAAAGGASLAYVFLTKPSDSSPASHPTSRSPSAPNSRHLSPPPELPASSKLLIPNINFDFGEPEPDVTSQCDYAPLWECIVNGNGGCEALEEELRECLARARKPEPSVTESNCDYAPLWECIVNGNGGCEALQEDLRLCLERSSRKFRRP
jgi:hypothetical protein